MGSEMCIRDSINSALQRARAGLKEHLPKERGEWTAEGSAEERALLDRYSETIVNSWAEGGFGTEAFGHCRCVATRTNRQPATANYLRPPGADEYTLAAVDLLRIEDGLITDVTAFYGPALKAFDLPRTLPV